MEQLWITLPAFAPDYSGVCSAMFDLKGLTVVHDASGCTGNYTGYDEPRWYGSDSKVFCSGLREIDAVLGNDEKLITNILKTGELVHPTIYTVVGSPVPMVIGTDTRGIAHELEVTTGFPAFGFDTNGLGLYHTGVSDAMCRLINRFTQSSDTKVERGINILGTTPLDFSANENAQDLKKRLEEWGFTVLGQMMMGVSIEQIRNLDQAVVNLVVTSSGLEAARLLEKKFSIPYVVGMPLENDMEVKELLEQTMQDKKSRALLDKAGTGDVLIVCEQVLGNSLRNLLQKRYPKVRVTVGTFFDLDKEIAAKGDINITSEEKMIEVLESGQYSTLVGDPLFEELLEDVGGMQFVGIPHVAVSSKLHWKEMPRLLSSDVKELIDRIGSTID